MKKFGWFSSLCCPCHFCFLLISSSANGWGTRHRKSTALSVNTWSGDACYAREAGQLTDRVKKEMVQTNPEHVHHRRDGVKAVTNLPADGDEQTLCCLQLQLRLTQQQTQHLQQLTVSRGNVHQRHPVYVACKCVQCSHGNTTVTSRLCMEGREDKKGRRERGRG